MKREEFDKLCYDESGNLKLATLLKNFEADNEEDGYGIDRLNEKNREFASGMAFMAMMMYNKELNYMEDLPDMNPDSVIGKMVAETVEHYMDYLRSEMITEINDCIISMCDEEDCEGENV